MALKYEDIKKEFQDMVNKDPVVQKLFAKIKKGNASYATTGKLAQQIGKDLGRTLKMHAPTTSIDEWDLDDLLPKSLGRAGKHEQGCRRQAQVPGTEI